MSPYEEVKQFVFRCPNCRKEIIKVEWEPTYCTCTVCTSASAVKKQKCFCVTLQERFKYFKSLLKTKTDIEIPLRRG